MDPVIAFDEDFEGELTENGDARTEVSLLAKIPDSEIAKAFINTELYARVSVAVLFYKLAEVAKIAGSGREPGESCSALESGKMFLVELLDSVVNDKDLAKELYKKHSAVSCYSSSESPCLANVMCSIKICSSGYCRASDTELVNITI